MCERCLGQLNVHSSPFLFKTVSPSSGQAGGSGIRLSRWEGVRDTPFKTSVETENNKLAGNFVELPSETTLELTKSH